MSTLFEYSQGSGLWKTPVEKSVDIVEKFGFSTAKPEISQFAPFHSHA
jgi:hypothetical protein